MKKVVLLFVLFIYTFSFAQENYKYIIVPKKFSFFKEENKYNLNTTTKAFFENNGFEVYFDTDEFPKELAENRCLALTVNAIENNNVFLTRINIELIDCYNKSILLSDLGTSREKEYQKAYTEAFRNALTNLKGQLNIKRTSAKSTVLIDNIVAATPVSKTNTIIDVSQLRAVPTETGYNLINHTNNIVIILHNTSLDNVFIASKEIFKGVLIKKNTGWFFEYDFEGKVYSEKVEVKF
ncbi:hypothetical protein [Flavobacterium sasangense]|uniref:hypothetical protein n=1 Tax=Flavobacterium sasangense TaxID=503361 RepID=UPI00047A4462|nr:hypothetical protein [Flavobacterium sasangense]